MIRSHSGPPAISEVRFFLVHPVWTESIPSAQARAARFNTSVTPRANSRNAKRRLRGGSMPACKSCKTVPYEPEGSTLRIPRHTSKLLMHLVFRTPPRHLSPLLRFAQARTARSCSFVRACKISPPLKQGLRQRAALGTLRTFLKPRAIVPARHTPAFAPPSSRPPPDRLCNHRRSQRRQHQHPQRKRICRPPSNPTTPRIRCGPPSNHIALAPRPPAAIAFLFRSRAPHNPDRSAIHRYRVVFALPAHRPEHADSKHHSKQRKQRPPAPHHIFP